MLIMLHKLFFAFITLSTLVTALPLTLRSSDALKPIKCGTIVTDDDQLIARTALQELWDSLDAREEVNGAAGLKPVTLDVYWHVIYANQTVAGGYLSDQQIAAQIDVLNADYKSTNISFALRHTTRLESAAWFLNAAPGMPEERAMKTRFHRGDAAALNVFSVQFNDTTPTLGFASLPSAYLADPVGDGVLVRHSTLPGGSTPHHDAGRTLVHEVGHWLGLYHTFEGGCSGVGDNIADTAPEDAPADGCPIGRRSCPDSGLADPVQNFMDYSWDSCMTHFTPGQTVRMHEAIWAFRTRRPGAPRVPTPAAAPPLATTTASPAPSPSSTISAVAVVAVEPTVESADGISEAEVEVQGREPEEDEEARAWAEERDEWEHERAVRELVLRHARDLEMDAEARWDGDE